MQVASRGKKLDEMQRGGVNAAKDLCPGCEELTTSNTTRRQSSVVDAVGRPWHERCALWALAETFRTPLSPEDATRAVSFDCECLPGNSTAVHQAMHSFRLREIIFPDGFDVTGIYVAQYIVAYGLMTPIRTSDLPGLPGERRVIIDRDVPLGVNVSVVGYPVEKLRFRLLGERRPEKQRPKPSAKEILAVAPLRIEVPVLSGKIAETSFCLPAQFRGDRVVVDDYEGWEISSVRIGRDPGRAVSESGRLTCTSTRFPTYLTNVGETVTYAMRNLAKKPRAFSGRVYGAMLFE